MVNFLALVVLVFGTFRIVRLIIEDTILEPLRERTVFKLNPQTSKIRELFACPWCLGFWLSILVVVLYWQWPDQTVWVMLPFAISAGVGLIAETQ